MKGDVTNMSRTYGLLLQNRWRETPDRLPVRNPYNGQMVAEVCRASAGELDEALAAAQQAFTAMRRLPAYERAGLLRRTAELIAARSEDFSRTICLEAGKPITAARAEVQRAINTFTLAAEEATRMHGEVLPLDISPASAGRIALIRRFPIGPVLTITPFNFPLNLVAHKIAPALAVGNPVVHKPSSAAPLTSLKLGEALIEAGMPSGAVNILPCPAALAEQAARDERLSMLSFTGSPAIGWRLKSICGRKKIALELGGNAAAVIEPDADMGVAVERCVFGGYVYAGQVCIALQRIYIHEAVYEQFARAFVDQVEKLATGDPLAEETFVGPLITPEEVLRVHAWVQEARSLGGQVLTGGTCRDAVYLPTVLANVPRQARCVCREVFGPVTVLFSYNGYEQALEAVNDSAYGLQAGIFTRDIGKIMMAFNRLEVGGVMVNDVPTFRADNFPYGGVKESGFGREGVAYAMEEMSEPKVLVVHDRP
jgi:glyceraldehyde-3-phosphate dehydrogenase (NADP+)